MKARRLDAIHVAFECLDNLLARNGRIGRVGEREPPEQLDKVHKVAQAKEADKVSRWWFGDDWRSHTAHAGIIGLAELVEQATALRVIRGVERKNHLPAAVVDRRHRRDEPQALVFAAEASTCNAHELFVIGLGAGKLCAAIGLRRIEQVVGDRHEAHLRGDSHVILKVVMEDLEALTLFLRQARLVHEDKAAYRAGLLTVRLGLPLDCTLEHGFDFLARAAARALVMERNERWSGLVKVGLRVLAARVLGDDCDGERLRRAGRADDHQRHLCEAADDDHKQILLESLGLRDARLEACLLHQRSHRFLERTFDVRILLAALRLEPRAETSAVILIKVARIRPEAYEIADRKGEEHCAVAALLQRLDARKKDGLHLPQTVVQEREEFEYPENVTQRHGRACPRVQLLLGDGTTALLHAVLDMFAREVSRLLLRGIHEVDERLHLIILQALLRLQEAKTLGDELELLIGL